MLNTVDVTMQMATKLKPLHLKNIIQNIKASFRKQLRKRNEVDQFEYVFHYVHYQVHFPVTYNSEQSDGKMYRKSCQDK